MKKGIGTMGKIRAGAHPQETLSVSLPVSLLLLIALVFLLAPNRAQAATSEEEAAAIASLNAGTAAIQAGRALEAIDYLNAAIEGNALDAERMALAYHHRGIANQKLGLGGHAVADYTSAIWQGGLPASILPRSYYNRAVAYAGMGQQERAARDYDKAIELAPNYASAYHNRGNLRRHQGRHKDAIADYDRALTLGMASRAHLTYFARALSHGELGDTSAAVADASRALESNADFEPAQTALAEWGGTLPTQVATAPAAVDPIVTASIPEPVQPASISPVEPARDPAPVAAAPIPAEYTPVEGPQSGTLDGIRIPTAASSAGQTVTLMPPNVAAIEPQSGSVTVRPLSEALPPPRATGAPGWEATVTRFAQPPLASDQTPRRIAAVPTGDPSTTASIDSTSPTPAARDNNLLTPGQSAPSRQPVRVAQGTSSTASDASPASSGLRVQIGSFRSASDATAAWDKTVAAHQELIGQRQPYIVEADLGERGIFYRLQIGPLHSSNEARTLCNALKARGQDCILAAR